MFSKHSLFLKLQNPNLEIILESLNKNKFSIEQELKVESIIDTINILKKRTNEIYIKKDLIEKDIISFQYFTLDEKTVDSWDIDSKSRIIKIEKETLFPIDDKSLNIEIVYQKYDLIKDRKKVLQKMKKVDSIKLPASNAGIHINLDKQTFLPSTTEIYKRNIYLQDPNPQHRQRVDFIYNINLFKGTSDFLKKRGNLFLRGTRIEFRWFDSNRKGIKKMKMFLKNSIKIDKKIKRKYELTCVSYNNSLYKFISTTDFKTLEKIEKNIKYNFHPLRNINLMFYTDELFEKNLKDEYWLFVPGFSASKEIYDKLFL